MDVENEQAPVNINLVPSQFQEEKVYIPLGTNASAVPSAAGKEGFQLPTDDPLHLLFFVGVAGLGLFTLTRFLQKG